MAEVHGRSEPRAVDVWNRRTGNPRMRPLQPGALPLAEALKAVPVLLVLTLAGFGMTGCGSRTKPTATHPTTQKQGVALLRRVHAAYKRVPAVETRGRLGRERVRITLLLSGGRTVAEEFFGTDPRGTTVLVAHGDSPTYAREPGTSCWRLVSRGNSQFLQDVGRRFPDTSRMQPKAPRRIGSTWVLPVVVRDRSSDKEHALTLRIDASTMLVRSESTRVNGSPVTVHVKTLTRQPKLATPRPTC
jgi:hypothetical protein